MKLNIFFKLFYIKHDRLFLICGVHPYFSASISSFPGILHFFCGVSKMQHQACLCAVFPSLIWIISVSIPKLHPPVNGVQPIVAIKEPMLLAPFKTGKIARLTSTSSCLLQPALFPCVTLCIRQFPLNVCSHLWNPIHPEPKQPVIAIDFVTSLLTKMFKSYQCGLPFFFLVIFNQNQRLFLHQNKLFCRATMHETCQHMCCCCFTV